MRAHNSRRQLCKTRQKHEVQGDGSAKRINGADPKVMEHKTDCHHYEKPNDENFFFRTHGHPPRPFSVSGKSLGSRRRRK